MEVSSFLFVTSLLEIFSWFVSLKIASTAMIFKFVHGLPFPGPPHVGWDWAFSSLSWHASLIHRLKLLHICEDTLPQCYPLPIDSHSLSLSPQWPYVVLSQYRWCFNILGSGIYVYQEPGLVLSPSLADSAKPHGKCLINVYWLNKWEIWHCPYYFDSVLQE